MRKFLALIILLCVSGCSPQKSLAGRLKGADRVVIMGFSGTNGLTLTDKEVDRIIRAIASGKKEAPGMKSGAGFRIEFFKGSKLLGSILASELGFGVGQNTYSDTTGTLKPLADRFYEAKDSWSRR